MNEELEHAVRRLACSAAADLTALFRRHVVQGQRELDSIAVLDAVNNVWMTGGGRAAAAHVAKTHKRVADDLFDLPVKRCRSLPPSFLSSDPECVPCTPPSPRAR